MEPVFLGGVVFLLPRTWYMSLARHLLRCGRAEGRGGSVVVEVRRGEGDGKLYYCINQKVNGAGNP